MKKVFSELAAYAINEQFNAGLRIESRNERKYR